MNIALDFASDWDYRGGVWRQGLSLATALVQILPPGSVSIPCFDRIPDAHLRELEQTGASVRADGPQRYLDRLEALARSKAAGGLRIKPWLARKLMGNFTRQWLLRRGVPETAVLHSLYSARSRNCRIPRVGTIHDMILLMPGYPAPAVAQFRETIESYRQDRSLVIVPSQTTLRDLVNQVEIPPSQVRVIYHGVDNDFFSPTGSATGETLARYGLTRHGFFLYVGSFGRRKNLEMLLRAYQGARTQLGVALPLVLTGPAGKSTLINRIRSEMKPHVRYLDYVPDRDLPDLYRGARATVLVSLYEGFGFPPLESMACGTPVIVSNCSSLPEVVGTAGLLVDPQDPKAIAGAFAALETNSVLRDELSNKSRAQAARFTWDRAARQHLDAYREAALLNSQNARCRN
jgi:alpha-1,3-rhamnosyl/mannosyltransferase